MFNDLFARWQEEQATEALLPLRDSFLQNLRVYIEELLSGIQSEKGSSLQKQLRKAELDKLHFLLQSLLLLRLRKIVNRLLAAASVDYQLLTRTERRFVDQVSRNIRNALFLVDELLAPLDAEASSRFLLLHFLEDHPQFVGKDLRTYGPFKAGDLATLPLENARLIIRRNGAEPVNLGASSREVS